MADGTCTAPRCDRPLLQKGLCGGHYQQWYKLGRPTDWTPRPLPGRGRTPESVVRGVEHGTERGYGQHQRRGETPCAECRTEHNRRTNERRQSRRAKQPRRAMPLRQCDECGCEFDQRQASQVRCGRKACQNRAYRRQRGERSRRDVRCQECGRTFESRRFDRENPYCGHSCAAKVAGRALQLRYRLDPTLRPRTLPNFWREPKPRFLPVLHPHPDPVTHLPAKHPARRKPPPNPQWRWWKVIVEGRCEWCEEVFTAPASRYDQRTLHCSDRCQRHAHEYRRGGKFVIPPRERFTIYARDGWVCQICGDPVDRKLHPVHQWAATLDHIVPRSKGGDDSAENLRLAHRWCNSVLGDGSKYSVDDLRVA